MIEPQQSKLVAGGYALVDDDIGLVLFCNGAIRVPVTLTGGFYCTLVNATTGTVTITVGGGSLRSVSGATAFTSQWQSCVLFKPVGGTDVFALGMP